MTIEASKDDDFQGVATSSTFGTHRSEDDHISELFVVEQGGGGSKENNHLSGSHKATNPKKWRSTACFAVYLVLLLVLVAVVIGLLLSLVRTTLCSSSSTSSTTSSGWCGTPSSSMIHRNKALLQSLLPASTRTVIESDPTSPQAKAADWLLQDPHFDALPYLQQPERLVQRFVLATLYYSTTSSSSSRWTRQDNWLEYDTHECEWYMRASSTSFTLQQHQQEDPNYSRHYDYYKDDVVHCDSQGIFRHLWMSQNGLLGSLPPELHLLTSLQSISLEKNPGMIGTIPSQLALLSNLFVLFLDNNHLTGSGMYEECTDLARVIL